MKAKLVLGVTLVALIVAGLATYSFAAAAAPPDSQSLVRAQGPAGGNATDPDSVSGTVTVTGQKQGALGQMILIGMSHEIVSPRDAVSGQATGKRQHKPFVIVKEWDKSTPLLLNALTTNETLTSVLIGLLKPNGQQFATIKLTNAHLSDYIANGLTEHWSFTYQKITWTWVDGGITAEDDWETPVAR